MKQFMAIFLGGPAAMEKWNALDEATRAERQRSGMQAWHDWMKKHEAVLAQPGGPLGKTKRVSAQGIEDIRNQMTGYVVIKAESHEAAAKMFLQHPHFAIFPGESVEIMECLPIPGM